MNEDEEDDTPSDSPKPEDEMALRTKLRLLLTARFVEAVSDPKARASTLAAATRFLAETGMLDSAPPSPTMIVPKDLDQTVARIEEIDKRHAGSSCSEGDNGMKMTGSSTGRIDKLPFTPDYGDMEED